MLYQPSARRIGPPGAPPRSGSSAVLRPRQPDRGSRSAQATGHPGRGRPRPAEQSRPDPRKIPMANPNPPSPSAGNRFTTTNAASYGARGAAERERRILERVPTRSSGSDPGGSWLRRSGGSCGSPWQSCTLAMGLPGDRERGLHGARSSPCSRTRWTPSSGRCARARGTSGSGPPRRS